MRIPFRTSQPRCEGGADPRPGMPRAASGGGATSARLAASVALVVGLVTGALPGASPARASPALAPGGTWPVRPAVVVAGFRPPAVRWGAGHRGVDLAAAAGDPVRSAAAGVVAYAGVLAGRGVVVVSHGTLRSTYEPVRSVVAMGDSVATGQLIGTVARGAGHCGGSPGCLHWGLRRGSAYLDPRLLVLTVRPVLLPPRGR